MQPDIFGDLNQWDGVLSKLNEIARHGSLDEHQIGLARILRFRQNQRLVHVGLMYANKVEKASDILIAEALNVLVSQDAPLSTRALAADVLGRLICHRPARTISDFDLERVLDTMADVLSRSESPMLKKGLWKAINAARTARERRAGS